MEVFAEDGPEALGPDNQDEMQQQLEGKAAKDNYIRYFLTDFIEFNMRKVAAANTKFCAH
jgi:hypothetical protein